MRRKGDLGEFEDGVVVGARRTGRSVSETAHPLGFSHTSIFRVYREWSKREKISTQWQISR